jgi:hypothetical protein
VLLENREIFCLTHGGNIGRWPASGR